MTRYDWKALAEMRFLVGQIYNWQHPGISTYPTPSERQLQLEARLQSHLIAETTVQELEDELEYWRNRPAVIA